ncbi:hypothetical protein ACQEVF_53625 [Nonomuraea polychroma]|uniref:hypothetical protein n=1 Tax=Nonomuraea polychroma TaxID=46176 RepID=UPI003D8F1F3C
MATLIAFDRSFVEAYPLDEARHQINRRMGFDIGYSLGADLSSVILGLSLLPPEDKELVASFARILQQGRVGHRYRIFLDRNAFPADVDCTAVAAHALHEQGLIPPDDYVAIARELLLAATPKDGQAGAAVLRPAVVRVYWDDGRESDTLIRGHKYDPVACANALCVLKQARRLGLMGGDHVVAATQRYVSEHLLSQAYRQGTRYYPYADAFLHAVSRLVKDFPDCRESLMPQLAEAIVERDAGPGADADDDRESALNVALRALAARNIGLGDNDRLRQRALLEQQQPDGAWPASPYFTLGRLPVYFGSRLLSTLFAAHALRPSHGGNHHDRS